MQDQKEIDEWDQSRKKGPWQYALWRGIASGVLSFLVFLPIKSYRDRPELTLTGWYLLLLREFLFWSLLGIFYFLWKWLEKEKEWIRARKEELPSQKSLIYLMVLLFIVALLLGNGFSYFIYRYHFVPD